MSSPSQAPEADGKALRRELRAAYDDLARDVAAAGPSCALSGRCCRFKEYDHTLFLSAIEAEVLVADAPAPSRPLDDGATCPWQDQQGRCTAREARPLGCRVYFCEPTYQGRSHDLSEEYLNRLKRISEAFHRPWNYAPLHHHLREGSEGPQWPHSSP